MVWVLLDLEGDAEATREAATSAIETGVDGMLVGEGETELVSSLSRLPVVERRGDRLFEEGARTGDVVEVASRGDVERAIGLLGKGRVVLIETPDWTVIPLEDLVAARHGESLSGLALALVDGVEDARLALGALEHGVDGVVVRVPAGSVTVERVGPADPEEKGTYRPMSPDDRLRGE